MSYVPRSVMSCLAEDLLFFGGRQYVAEVILLDKAIEDCLTTTAIGTVKAAETAAPTKPDLTGLKHFSDWFSLGLRQRICAMAGDYEKEIDRIFSEGRFKTARWNKALAWGYAILYVLRGPVDFLVWVWLKLRKLVLGG